MNRRLIKRLEALELRHDPGRAPKSPIPEWLLESWELQVGIIPDGLDRMTDRVGRCAELSRKQSWPTA